MFEGKWSAIKGFTPGFIKFLKASLAEFSPMLIATTFFFVTYEYTK
jgi:hypothetical protein